MFIAMKTVIIKHNNKYYKLKAGEFIEKLPKKLEKRLVKNKYIVELVVADDDLLPEEDLDLQEVKEIDLSEELMENEHKIREEGIFNFRKEDEQ